MPAPAIAKIPLMEAPEQWVLPKGIEVRRGVPKGGSGEVIAFRNPRTREACAAMVGVLDLTQPLPDWLMARIKSIS